MATLSIKDKSDWVNYNKNFERAKEPLTKNLPLAIIGGAAVASMGHPRLGLGIAIVGGGMNLLASATLIAVNAGILLVNRVANVVANQIGA